jgi:hypothetical protein
MTRVTPPDCARMWLLVGRERRLRLALAAGVALSLLFACSSGASEDGSSSTLGSEAKLSFAAWHMEVSEICSAAHGEVEALEQAAGTSPSDDQLMVAIRGTFEIGGEQFTSISEVGTPDDRSAEIEALITAMERQLDLFGPIIEAGETGNPEALQSALRSPEVASTQAHLNSSAVVLDLPDCGTGGGE